VAGYYQKPLRDRLLRVGCPGRDAVRIAQQFTAGSLWSPLGRVPTGTTERLAGTVALIDVTLNHAENGAWFRTGVLGVTLFSSPRGGAEDLAGGASPRQR